MIDKPQLTPEQNAAAVEFLTNMLKQMRGENDTCLHCQTPITDMKQHGRCVYAYPCGCRQYQGKLSGKWAKK